MLTYIKSFNVHPSPSGVDNTPNAVNWANLTYDISDNLANISSQQITGISTSISLNISEESTSPEAELYYRVGNSDLTGNLSGAPASPWVQVVGSPGTTFSVSNNEWVSFVCYSSGSTKVDPTTLTVYNSSDNDAPLDSFTIQIDT